MKALAIILFSQLLTSNWDGPRSFNVTLGTNVKRLYDDENDTYCYVLLEGTGIGKGVGISCVKR